MCRYRKSIELCVFDRNTKMIHRNTFLVLTVVKLLCLNIASLNDYFYTDRAPFNLFTMSKEFLFVGGQSGVTVLGKDDLSERKSYNDIGNNWFLMYNEQKDNIIQCSQSSNNISSCLELNFTSPNSNNRTLKTMKVNITHSPVYTRTSVPKSNNDILVIGATSLQIPENDMRKFGIISLNLNDFEIFDTSQNSAGPMNLEIGQRFKIFFKSALTTENFVFFFFQLYLPNENHSVHSRVGKLCKKMKGKKKNDGYYHFYEDIGLKCKVGKIDFTNIERAVLVNNKTFIVIFKNGQANAVCIFPVKTIIDKMVENRIRHLDCNRTVYGSYFKPNLTVNADKCFKAGSSTREDKFRDYANGMFCDETPYSTLWNGYPLESSNTLYNTTQQLSAMAAYELEGTEAFILFLGTDSGNLIVINASSSDSHFKKLNLTSERIIDILIDDKRDIFLLTQYQIIKTNLSYVNCFNQKCSSKKNVHNSNLKIVKIRSITEAAKNDYKLMISNSSVQIQNKAYIEITVHLVPAIAKYTCGICNTTVLRKAEGNNRTNTCKFDELETMTTGNYTFAIIVNETKIATAPIEIYKCKEQNSCHDCVPKAECGWKQYEGQCSWRDYTFIENKCPVLGRNNSSIQQVYATHENITIDVPFVNKSISHIPKEMICEATGGNFSKRSRAIVDQITYKVTCDSLDLGVGQTLSKNTLFDVRLLYRDDTFMEGHIQIEVYTCQSNLTANDDCTECKDQDYRFPCSWCESNGKGYCYSEFDECDTGPVDICHVNIASVSPLSGPVNGGTVVALHGRNLNENITSVYFEDFECGGLKYNTKSLVCNTPSVLEPKPIKNITVWVNNTSFPQLNSSHKWFEYKKPILNHFYPNRSIQSGGRSITIVGTDIGFHGVDRYKIAFYGKTRHVECSNVTVINDHITQCLTGNESILLKYTSLQVVIDINTTLLLNQTFTYVKDPSGFELSNETASVQQSGGAKIAINGEGFNEVGKVTIDRVVKPCDIESDTLVKCETPEYSGNRSQTGKVSETVNVYFDGLKVPVAIDYVGDPLFEHFRDVIEYEKDAAIEITGRNILTGARWDDYTIHIGKTGLCYTERDYVTDTKIKCWPPRHVPLTNYTDKNLVYIHVKVGRLREHIGVLRYIEETNHLVIVISVLAASLVIVVGVGIGVVLTLRKKRKKAEKRFMFELQTVEERVRTNSREEFAEMQIAIGDIQSDLVTSKVPYRDYQTYLLLQLFPNQDPESNSLLLHLQVSNGNDGKYKQAVEKLELLLQNKLFLKSLVQTLDRPNTLTVKEKAQFAALLSVSMLGKMRLFYELVHCLVTDSVRFATKRQQRGLFRRLDSITCRMMTNLLQMVLYKQLQGQTGMQLFLLMKSVQTVMERGPVDAVTSHCKNTLCEEKLLKLRVDSEQYTLNIDLNGNSEHCYQVKVLECDTISQVKRKCCAQIYKNRPASEIPKFEELELEWKEGHAGRLLLQDIDQTSERTDQHVRLNTLTHYKVKNECRMALLYGVQEDDVYMNTTGQNESTSFEDVNLLMSDASEKDENLQKWHLSTSHVDEGPNLERDIGDIYLNRLFHTKLLLSKYIDSMFESLLDPECVSMPVSYFIQALDKIGKANSVDPEVLQIWKNECYATRIWAPLIAKPQAAFDIHVPEHVDHVMDVLGQVFVESLTQSPFRVNKESPTQRLLFHKDIERYRKSVGSFYSQMEPVSDHDFWRTLDQLSDMQKEDVKLSQQSTIHQLYNLFIAKYRDKILMDFEDMEESRSLQFGPKLEEIFELMEEE